MLYSYPTAILLGLAGVIALLLVARVRAYRRLSHIPGPFWTGWTDLWLIKAQLSGRISFILADANTKYGMFLKFFFSTPFQTSIQCSMLKWANCTQRALVDATCCIG